MTRFARFAVYHVPPEGPLAAFGAAWLGWDIAAGAARAHPSIAGLPRPVAELTAAPRRYGFHATLKPPFRLAPGSTPQALLDDLAALAGRLAPVRLEGLAPAVLGRFVALRPEGDPHGIAALAAEVVAGLDRHRAPPTPEELARRGAGLAPREAALLRRWGYPYVMAAFRFHLTLTGPLPRPEAAAVRAALAPLLAPLLPRPCPVDALALCGEDGAGRFHLLARVPLGGGAVCATSLSPGAAPR